MKTIFDCHANITTFRVKHSSFSGTQSSTDLNSPRPIWQYLEYTNQVRIHLYHNETFEKNEVKMSNIIATTVSLFKSP